MSEGKDRLKQIRNALGMSQAELDNIMCFKTYTVNSVEGGKQKLSVRIAIALREKIVQTPDGRLRIVNDEKPRQSDEAELRMEWLLTGEGEPFDKTLGHTDVFRLEFDNNIINLPHGDNIKFYTMPDDSMSPDFYKDDYIAFDKNNTNVKNGGDYLISVFDECILRRIFKTGKDKLKITAINEVFPSFEIDKSEVEVIGKQLYSMRISQD